MRLVKRDANHRTITAALKAAGVPYRDVSHLGGFGCDLVVVRGCWPAFLEIKDGAKPPSARKLTPSELALQAMFPGSYYVVTTVEEALAAVGINAGP